MTDINVTDADREYTLGPWKIHYDPPPIPARNCDWHYTHGDDDGAPDGSSARSGHGESLQDCLSQIEELLFEQQAELIQDAKADLLNEVAALQAMLKAQAEGAADQAQRNAALQAENEKLREELIAVKLSAETALDVGQTIDPRDLLTALSNGEG